ncbi:MAG: molybdopterin molybdotransferase MoeA [Candidatus Omnitrophica bacterium]|nr:molybdopterin molybdotransferase MoeA [Candidatus Omnitrophota bacterium]
MISVQDADKIIQDHVREFSTEEIPLHASYRRVLREDLLADRDLPPFNRSTMDGFAVSRRELEKGRRVFMVCGTQPAGIDPRRDCPRDNALEIMTGAVVPEVYDVVIPVEYCQLSEGSVTVREDYQPGENAFIHLKGADAEQGRVILKKNARLTAPRVSIAASIGKTRLKVTKKIQAAVISTGDEIVPIDTAEIRPYQIRASNCYACSALLDSTGLFETSTFHLKDDPKEMKTAIKPLMETFDTLILSGGVSMGRYDYVPRVLKELGVSTLFHKVSQRPGKPFWFGLTPQGRPVFALPGNPVSTQVCCRRYVLQHLTRAAGLMEKKEYARLTTGFDFQPSLTYFLPVKLSRDPSACHFAEPILNRGSGDFTALAESNGIMELESSLIHFQEGHAAPIYRWENTDE